MAEMPEYINYFEEKGKKDENKQTNKNCEIQDT